jgi:AraC-like DNA-binding protein
MRVVSFFAARHGKNAGGQTAFAVLQTAHVAYFLHDIPLLSQRWYALLLAMTPITFYFFSRELLFHGGRPAKRDLAHGIILPVVFLLPLPWAAVASFIVGCGYTLHIFLKVLRLRTQIPRFRFERFFFAFFFAMNILALALGLSAPWLSPGLFYHGYAGSVSIALILVVTALLNFPDLLSDVLLASETVYAKSKLGNLNVGQMNAKLEQLMLTGRSFEDENLTLASTAEQLGISAQQLSELVNSRFGLSFPRYVRQHRVEAAKQMLVAEPDASVLSVGLANGFKSQSSFYTAFKEHTGQTPAAYRSALRADTSSGQHS